MPTEVTSLALNVKSDSVAKGASRLDKFSTSATKAETSQKKLTGSTKKGATTMGKNAVATGAAGKTTKGLSVAQVGATATTKGLSAATVGFGTALKTTLGPLLALIGPVLLLKKAFSTTVELQNFQAQLKTATGSVENAADAFEALEEFASETPYALEQSLEAFTKLVNLGLTPSEKALKSYGNTASAMGKDLTQLIEAVADAATGEFERLKEFGIKAKSEGDKVSFTFRGVTTQIGKNAAEIEGYLMALGENEFGGAMSDRMATVGGQVSNLGDLWNQLFRTVSEMGVGNAIGDSLQFGIDMLTEFIAVLKSGQFEAELDSWTVGLDDWAKDFGNTLEIVGALFGEATSDWADDGENFWSDLIDAAKLIPAAIRYWVQRIGVEISAIVFYGQAAGEALLDVFINSFKLLLGSAKTFGKAVGSALNPFDDTDFSDAFKRGLAEQNAAMIESGKKTIAILGATETKINSMRQGRLDLLKEIEVDFERSVDQAVKLGMESDKLRAKYDAEREARRKARADGSAGDALAKFKIVPGQPKGGATSGATGVDTAKVDAAQKEADKLAKIEERKQKRIIAAERKAQEARERSAARRISNTANLFSALSNLDRSQSEKTQKRNQALAITAATINTYQGATEAYKDPTITSTYGKLAAAAVVVATGLAQVQNIRDAGNYATGGIIPGTSTTGDNLQANVNSGEMILNRAQQSRLFDIANSGNSSTSGNGSTQLNVTIENYGSSEITAQQISATEVRIIARDVVREEAPAVVAADLGNPNSRTSNALARNTNSQRRR